MHTKPRSLLGLTLCALLVVGLLAACAGPAAPATKPATTTPPTTTIIAQAQATATMPATHTATAPATSTPAATATASATATAVSTPTVAPTPAPPPVDALLQQVKGALPAKAFADVKAFALISPEGRRQLFVVYTTGMRGHDTLPPPSHFVAIYSWENASWQQVARVDLDTKDASPDFVEGAKQVDLGAPLAFIQVTGGAGAHGGTYQLVSFAGQQLRLELSAGNAFPGFGQTVDLNGDGKLDVALDNSDAYVFCYACGVRKPLYRAYSWDNQQNKLVEVKLAPLAASTPPQPYLAAANRAVELAKAGMWQGAAAKSAEAGLLATGAASSDSAQMAWNEALIKLHADAAQREVAKGAYPLLANVFYGDYPAAVDLMRQYPPSQVFDVKSPLVDGTVAMNWVKQLSAQITASTNAALQVEPNLAAAYFLRGWAAYLNKEGDPAAKADVAKAAALAPNDAFYKAAAEYLK